MEPLLYRSVLLNSRKKWVSFGYTLQTKDPEFLSKNVHALWILFGLKHTLPNDSESLDSINYCHLFRTLKNLTRLGLVSFFFHALSRVTSPSSIRELTLVKPEASSDIVCVDHLSLRTLHVIDPIIDLNILRMETDFSPIWKIPQDYFRKIPQIYYEFTNRPTFHPVEFIRAIAILLTGVEKDSPSAVGYHSTLPPLESRFLLIKHCLNSSGLFTNMGKLTVDQNATSWAQALAVYEARGPPDRTIRLESVYLSEEQLQWYGGLYNSVLPGVTD